MFFGKPKEKAHNEHRLTCTRKYMQDNGIKSGDTIWFSIDENLIVREIDIHTLIDGVTQYDIGVLNMQDVYVLLNLLNNIRKPLKK